MIVSCLEEEQHLQPCRLIALSLLHETKCPRSGRGRSEEHCTRPLVKGSACREVLALAAVS